MQGVGEGIIRQIIERDKGEAAGEWKYRVIRFRWGRRNGKKDAQISRAITEERLRVTIQ